MRFGLPTAGLAAELLEEALAGGEGLLLLANGRLLIVRPAPDLLKDPGTLHLTAEAAKGALKRLALTDSNSHGCHLLRALAARARLNIGDVAHSHGVGTGTTATVPSESRGNVGQEMSGIKEEPPAPPRLCPVCRLRLCLIPGWERTDLRFALAASAADAKAAPRDVTINPVGELSQTRCVVEPGERVPGLAQQRPYGRFGSREQPPSLVDVLHREVALVLGQPRESFDCSLVSEAEVLHIIVSKDAAKQILAARAEDAMSVEDDDRLGRWSRGACHLPKGSSLGKGLQSRLLLGDSTDVRAERGELFLDVLVAPVQVVNAPHLGQAFGCEPRDHKGYRGA